MRLKSNFKDYYDHVRFKFYGDPIPALTDKEKILSHGFDLKDSFRGK